MSSAIYQWYLFGSVEFYLALALLVLLVNVATTIYTTQAVKDKMALLQRQEQQLDSVKQQPTRNQADGEPAVVSTTRDSPASAAAVQPVKRVCASPASGPPVSHRPAPKPVPWSVSSGVPRPSRVVHHADCMEWLQQQSTPMDAAYAFVTSIADVSEVGMSPAAWQQWFVGCAEAVMRRCDARSVCIFYQTDIKRDGVWIDKGALIQDAAKRVGVKTVFHKIVVCHKVTTVSGARATYSHLLCFSAAHVDDFRLLTPDIIEQRGAMTWNRAMGLHACEVVIHYIKRQLPHVHTVVDIQCGMGSILAMANYYGLNAIGVELSDRRARKARTLHLDGSSFKVNEHSSVEDIDGKKRGEARLARVAEKRARKQHRKAAMRAAQGGEQLELEQHSDAESELSNSSSDDDTLAGEPTTSLIHRTTQRTPQQ